MCWRGRGRVLRRLSDAGATVELDSSLSLSLNATLNGTGGELLPEPSLSPQRQKQAPMVALASHASAVVKPALTMDVDAGSAVAV